MGLRVGVIGTGKLGQQHVRVLKRVPEVDHVGCFDIHGEKSEGVAAKFGAKAYASVEQLLDSVDSVSVVVPTTAHAEVSLKALDLGKNIFVEKPIAASIDDAQRIIKAAKTAKSILQVGHIERFNSAVQQSIHFLDAPPAFIEVHRLAPFTVRGTDVSVVMDLMIHDLDLLGLFVGEDPSEIRAKGASILTQGPDIVNARIEFPSGCVANLTASRVSVEPMRKVRIFSKRNYLSIDLLKGRFKHIQKGQGFEAGVASLRNRTGDVANLSMADFVKIDERDTRGEEPLFDELRSFCQTVAQGASPVVSGEDGLKALRMAVAVQRIVETNPG